jgi:K+/H+ antiporter YhaU regulatory subunit KhtT
MQLRKNFGVTLVALKRGDTIIEHPEAYTTFQGEDVAYIMGKPEQIATASSLFGSAEKHN